MNIKIISFAIVFLSISLILNHTVYAQVQSPTGNLSKVIEDKFSVVIPPSEGYYQSINKSQVEVVYESPTTIMLSGELLATRSPESTMGVFNSGIWAARDLLKNQYGFKVQQVMTSGQGSVGNPTTVYILMTK